MDMTRQLPRLKFVALWGALTLTFAFPAQVFAAPEETITIATLLKGGCRSQATPARRTAGRRSSYSGIRTSRISCNAVQAMT